MPPGSGLAQSSGTLSDSPVVGADVAHSQNPPSEDSGNTQHPTAPAGPRVAFAQPFTSGVVRDPDEDDDHDHDSVVDPPVVDKTLTPLFNFMYNKFVDARPLSDTSAPPRCEFKEYLLLLIVLRPLVSGSGSTPG